MIRQVPIADVVASKELIAEYAQECSNPDIGPIDPSSEIYAALENAGVAHSFMADDVGFAIVLTPVIPHYSKRVATVESLFVAKANRSIWNWFGLRKSIKQKAREAGCAGVIYSCPSGGPLEKILEKTKGCRRTNSVFFEKL